MMDDKAAIPIGPPGAPVSATRRQRATLQTGVEDLNSCDHVAQHLTPSVSVVMDAPINISSSDWYAGSPEVILKCAIFEPSNAFRHTTEISRRLVNVTKPMLFGVTDGGPDHNTMHIQVQLSLIALFLKLDLDFLCFVRTPPNYSILNPVERIMCVLNIALVGVATCRTTLDQHEQLVKNVCSKAQWREAASRHPHIDFRKLSKLGTENVRKMFESRILSMCYKDEQFTINEPATDEEIKSMKNELALFF